MKLLTAAETSEWLKSVGQVEDPHGRAEVDPPDHHLQFYAPHKYSVIEAFVRVFMENFTAGEEVLLQITDYFPFVGAERYVIERLWSPDGKVYNLDDKPGCVLDKCETETAVALFALTSCFGWKCYLYGNRDQVILFNWEGDVWDVWTASEYKMLAIRELVDSFQCSAAEQRSKSLDQLPFAIIPED